MSCSLTVLAVLCRVSFALHKARVCRHCTVRTSIGIVHVAALARGQPVHARHVRIHGRMHVRMMRHRSQAVAADGTARALLQQEHGAQLGYAPNPARAVPNAEERESDRMTRQRRTASARPPCRALRARAIMRYRTAPATALHNPTSSVVHAMRPGATQSSATTYVSHHQLGRLTASAQALAIRISRRSRLPRHSTASSAWR